MKKYSIIGILVFADIILINLAFIFALLLRFDFVVHSDEFGRYLTVYANWAVFITVIKIAVNGAMGLYSSLWKYAGTHEVFRVCVAAIIDVSSVVLVMLYFEQMLPRSVYLMTLAFDILFLGGSRIGYRMFRSVRHSGDIRRLPGRILHGGAMEKDLTGIFGIWKISFPMHKKEIIRRSNQWKCLSPQTSALLH